MQLHIYKTVDELLENIAAYFLHLANESFAANKRFSVALPGGNSPKKLFALLASDAYKDKLAWSNIDFFFGDERYVPQTSADSNFKMANDVLLQPLNIAAKQIFAVDTSLSPNAAAEDYWNRIQAYFNGNEQRFGLIILGLGDNAHTASLFPYTPVLSETVAGIRSVFLANQNTYRITFTAPLINLAANVAFLVYGDDKAIAVKRVLEAGKNTGIYPAQLIEPLNGKLDWFLDEGAASKLSSTTQ
ncbi:MAG: 6-phosphogluconolactonase [Bacteroidota bacterium]